MVTCKVVNIVQLAPVKSRTVGLRFNVHSGRFQVHETHKSSERTKVYTFTSRFYFNRGLGKKGVWITREVYNLFLLEHPVEPAANNVSSLNSERARRLTFLSKPRSKP